MGINLSKMLGKLAAAGDVEVRQRKQRAAEAAKRAAEKAQADEAQRARNVEASRKTAERAAAQVREQQAREDAARAKRAAKHVRPGDWARHGEWRPTGEGMVKPYAGARQVSVKTNDGRTVRLDEAAVVEFASQKHPVTLYVVARGGAYFERREPAERLGAVLDERRGPLPENAAA